MCAWLRSAAVVALLLAETSAADPLLGPWCPDHARVMLYCDAAGRGHPVTSPADWRKRRAQIIAGMEEAMGPLPDLANLPPLDVRIDDSRTVKGNGYTRLSLTYASDEDRVPAYLYLPANQGEEERRPAMLALHPTDPLGKAVVDGAGPRPSPYGKELAQRGYVVLAPDYPSFGDYPCDFKSGRYASGTMRGIVNHMRGVDLLRSLPEVDPDRIGAIGHSLGGHNAMFVGAFDERLQVVIASCGWTPFHDYFGGKIDGWTSGRYMPRLKEVYRLDTGSLPFDFYEVVAALAPRAFFSVSPEQDANFAVAGVRKAEQEARKVFQLFGAGERLKVRYPDCAHDFREDMRNEAYAFVDQVLRHKTPPVSAMDPQ